jgi:hypothetical protein
MKTHGKVATIVAAVAAMAISSIALAEPNPNRVTGKEKPKNGVGPGSKFSIEVDNYCKPDSSTNTLKIESTITNETEGPVEVGTVDIMGLQLVPDEDPDSERKNPKKTWVQVGAVKTDIAPGIVLEEGGSDVYEHTIYLCNETPVLQPDATALNVQVQVMIDGRNFVGNCDDQNIVDNEGNQVADESRIDIEDSGLGC